MFEKFAIFLAFIAIMAMILGYFGVFRHPLTSPVEQTQVADLTYPHTPFLVYYVPEKSGTVVFRS